MSQVQPTRKQTVTVLSRGRMADFAALGFLSRFKYLSGSHVPLDPGGGLKLETPGVFLRVISFSLRSLSKSLRSWSSGIYT